MSLHDSLRDSLHDIAGIVLPIYPELLPLDPGSLFDGLFMIASHD